MADHNIQDSGAVSPFEQIKHTTEQGLEFWSARELRVAMGYTRWEAFEQTLERAQVSCLESGIDTMDHFQDVLNMIPTGKGASREVKDVLLTRYGCYLVAMSGDPSKMPVIAEAQSYFAVQTIRQENIDRLTDERKRILRRDRVKDGNIVLRDEAHARGVQNFGQFQNAGYAGLYLADVHYLKTKRNIPDKHDILDYMPREELALNEMRITQTEAKLKRDNIQGENDATNAHRRVGEEIRKAVVNIGGTLPENIPPATPIWALEKKPEHKAFVAGLASERSKPSNRLERPKVSLQSRNAKWPADRRVVLVGVVDGQLTSDGLGYHNFTNINAARELFPDLDIYRDGHRFTRAIGNPEEDPMRFETWAAEEIYRK